MKNIILSLLFVLFAVNMMAGDLERNVRTFGRSATYVEASLVAGDTLTSNQDSILYQFLLNKDYPVQYAIYIDADSIAGIDTTLTVQVLGKLFVDDSYTQISSSSITAFEDTAFSITSQSEPTYTLTFATSTDTLLADTTSITYALDTYGGDSVAFYKYTLENVAHTASMVPAAIAKYYRYLAVRLSLPGDDSTGGGYTINKLYIKIWERKF